MEIAAFAMGKKSNPKLGWNEFFNSLSFLA
jgi:hypothetical protein